MSGKPCSLDEVSFGASLSQIADFAADYLQKKHDGVAEALQHTLRTKGKELHAATDAIVHPCKNVEVAKAERDFPSGSDKINPHVFIASENYIPQTRNDEITRFKIALNEKDILLSSKTQPMPGWVVVQQVTNPDIRGMVPEKYLVRAEVGASKVENHIYWRQQRQSRRRERNSVADASIQIRRRRRRRTCCIRSN